MSAAKIKKGDRVVVLSGKDKGKHGDVVRAIPKDMKVVVKGVNVVARHTKPTQAAPQGGIVRKEAPIHVSKVAIEDPKTGKPTRVGFRIENGQKVRVAKRSGEVING
jgi:large subunit ribosomal protein L24